MAASLIQSCWICELVHAGIQILFYLLLAENSNWEDWSHGSHPALLEAAPVLCLLMFLLSKARQPCSSPLATEWTNVARCTSNMKASIYCTVVTGTFISGRIRQSRSCSSRCRGCNLGCPSAFDPVRRASRSAMGTTQLFPRCLLGQVMVVPVEEEDILYVQHVMPLHTSFFFFLAGSSLPQEMSQLHGLWGEQLGHHSALLHSSPSENGNVLLSAQACGLELPGITSEGAEGSPMDVCPCTCMQGMRNEPGFA